MLTQPAPLSAQRQPQPNGLAMFLSTMASGIRRAMAQAFAPQTRQSASGDHKDPDAFDLPAHATARAKRLMRNPD